MLCGLSTTIDERQRIGDKRSVIFVAYTHYVVQYFTFSSLATRTHRPLGHKLSTQVIPNLFVDQRIELPKLLKDARMCDGSAVFLNQPLCS